MSHKRTSVIKPHNLIVIPSLMALEWILLVAGTKRDEMIVGALSVVAASVFLCVILRTEKLEFNFTLRDVATAWRVPWYILGNTCTLVRVLLLDLFGVEAAGSYYRVSGFKTGKTDPTLVARRVLATVYTTVSPNSIVIGIDCAQSRMLLHQVARDEISAMTKELGGQP